jgi:hypothetical protein
VIVVTHSVPDGWPRPDSMVLFNTEGIESALAQAREIAPGKDIALGSPKVIRLFENLYGAPLELETPFISEGNGVAHFAYRLS